MSVNNMDELIAQINTVVSGLNIPREDKLSFLVLLTEIGYEFKKTADAIEELQKRKHGKWLDVTTLDNEFICWVCSECRHGTDFVYEPYNYCPNCGADMRGES